MRACVVGIGADGQTLAPQCGDVIRAGRDQRPADAGAAMPLCDVEMLQIKALRALVQAKFVDDARIAQIPHAFFGDKGRRLGVFVKERILQPFKIIALVR